MIRLDPLGGMSLPLPPSFYQKLVTMFFLLLNVSFSPLAIVITFVQVMFRFIGHVLGVCPIDLRPTSPGRCWWDVLALPGSLTVNGIPAYRNSSLSRATLDELYFGEVLPDWLSHLQVRHFHAAHMFNFPFVRVARVPNYSDRYHLFPANSSRGRLTRVSRIPKGWYGAGPLDPSFYSDSPLRSVILSMHMGAYGKTLTAARQQCPYDVPTRMRPLLSLAGINDPPPHAPAHGHPVHYALRNKYMTLAAKSLQGKWFALFAGPDRINYLRSCGASAPVGTFSPRYDGKDITRHAGHPVPAINMPSSNAPVWFVCDSLHHMSASTVGSWFDRNPKLEYVVATTIIPPETLWDLPSLTPALYSYKVDGNRLTYIPEKDLGGAYVQPLSARNWLKTDALITPQNRCVHVSLLAQDFAHQLIVISRAPLLPQERRLMAIRNVSIVPWFVHPLGSLQNRLTSPGLNRALQSYITRVGSTSIRDIYSKSTAHETAVFEKYPVSFVRAGALYAKWMRDIDYHSSANTFTYIRWVLTMTTRLPLIPFRWWWQSYTSIFFQMDQDQEHLWEVECSTLVSRLDDPLLPGVTSKVCPNKLGIFQLQPGADRLSRSARTSAQLMANLSLKIVGVITWPLVHWCLRHVTTVLDALLYALDLHWNTSPAGVCFTIALVLAGVRGPAVDWPSLRINWVPDAYYSFFAYIYQLPSCRHVYRVGISWFYLFSLNFALFTFAFPHAHPVIFFLDYVLMDTHRNFGDDLESPEFGHIPEPPPWIAPLPPGRPDDNLEPGFNISSFKGVPGTITHHHLSAHYGYHFLWWACMLVNAYIVLSVFLSVNFFAWASGARKDYLPIHDHSEHNDLECGTICFHHPPDPPSDPDPPSGGPPDNAGPPDPPSYQNDILMPEPVPRAPVGRLNNDARAALDIPYQEELPQLVLPPVVPGAADPLRHYDLPPRVIGNFATWQNLMARLPDPPNQLDPNNMCVWDVLAANLGLRAPVVWACWVSQIPPASRFNYTLGFVPPEDLSRIMAYFACTFTIRSGLSNGICPRGPGLAQPPCEFNPAEPPYMEGAGLEGFPNFVAYLQNNQDGSFHFSSRGQALVNGAPMPPPTAADWIGWVSRLVPNTEIGEVVAVPAKGFATVYRRILGNMANPMSAFQMAGRLRNYVLPAVPVVHERVVYRPNARDAGYARALASDFKAKPMALDLTDFSPIDAARTLDQMAKQYQQFVATGNGIQYPDVTFHLFHGVGGGGKSFKMIQDLAAQHAQRPFSAADITFHTWDHNLRNQFMSDVLRAMPNAGLQPNNFMTGCIPLVRPSAGTMVFDDAGLLYNSYLPLFLASNPGITDIWLTFDCAQGQGVIPTANSISRSHPATKDWLSPMCANYGTEVVRWSQETADLYGFPRRVIPGRVAPRGSVHVVSQSPRDVPLLAVSPRFTQTQSMGGQVANTFQECQGHTIHGDVCVDLGGLTATSTDASAWTALTRPTGNTFLKIGAIVKPDVITEPGWAKSQILTALLTLSAVRCTPYLTAAIDVDGIVRGAVYSHLASSLSPAACTRLGLPAPSPVIGTRGVSKEYRAAWLNNSSRSDFYTARTQRAAAGVGGASGSAFSRYTAQVSNAPHQVSEIVRHFTDLDPEAVLHTESTGYSLPEAQPITAQPDPVDDINEPLDDVLRETAIPEDPWTLTQQHIVDGAPDALHHTRADKITDILGQRKRIRVGLHDKPWSPQDARRLRALKRGFSKFFDMPAWQSEPINQPLMEECERDKLASWASKRTKRELQASIDKQDLDQAYTFTRLFPKGQYIKKKAKWRCNAFASQTISDFHLGRIFRDAPRALYLEKMALKHALPSTYLHCRASPDDLSKWYRSHWRPGNMTGNDYTAWDSGIDHVFLAFDLWLMELCHFPKEYMDRFEYERLHTHSFLGNHMPRQESGDRWTWILNTLRNAALTGASLDCPKGTPVCISGDDSVTLGGWRKTTGFNPSEWLMVPKREEGFVMEFCGLIFGGADVSFDPAVVHWRSRFGLQQGRRDADYWLSIRQAIVETSAKLGTDSPKLAGALLNLRRAILYFNLPNFLDIADAEPEPTHPVDSCIAALQRCVFGVFRWLLFL
uniref:RNA-dependent RNA polymerase n=1 Tax=Qingyuan Delta tick virus 1 TaxID=2972096 RepID=A0A9E7V1S2_9VIRU|nr:MAG: RNA-dependent RNA polymerase [Qingyuan Delta tick virus 1]